MDLAAINLPGYAQDDQALAAAIEQALSQVRSIEQHLNGLDEIQKTLNANAELQSDLLHKARQTRERYNNDLRFAREARQRLFERYQHLQQQRRQGLQEQQQQLAKQLEALKSQQKNALHERDSAFNEMLLEYQADWQQAVQVLREQIDQHKQKISAKSPEK